MLKGYMYMYMYINSDKMAAVHTDHDGLHFLSMSLQLIRSDVQVFFGCHKLIVDH